MFFHATDTGQAKENTMSKYLIAAAAALSLAACTSQPMRSDVLRAHAELNCRVAASVNKAYAIDSTGVSLRSVAYGRCMAARGFVAVK